jgi:hypothetical protein
MADLEKVGIAINGQLLLEQTDIDALIAGRRTELIRLSNLRLDGAHIREIDAKLSLRPDGDGQLELLLHPIYREAPVPDCLTLSEAETLEKGEALSLLKMDDGKEVIVEFDDETNEFVRSEIERILQPFQVNSETLTPEQLQRFRKGKEVELEDGTKFQYSGTDAAGIRSNRLALIASILMDGGLTYIVYSGLKAIYGQKRDPVEAAILPEGYHKAADERNHTDQPFNVVNRGYSRTGVSR